MAKFLLSVHVIAAIVFIGPVTVTTSLFPRYARAALTPPGGSGADALHLLHRISRVYAVLGLTVPAFGLATAVRLDVLGDAWLLTSIALTAIAAGVLALGILPAQARLMARVGTPATDPGTSRLLGRLGATAGAFSLLWTVVVVLMIVRPGSTTGA